MRKVHLGLRVLGGRIQYMVVGSVAYPPVLIQQHIVVGTCDGRREEREEEHPSKTCSE